MPVGTTIRLDQAEAYFKGKFKAPPPPKEPKATKGKRKIGKAPRVEIIPEEDEEEEQEAPEVPGTFIFADVTASPIKKKGEFLASDHIFLRRRKPKLSDSDSDDSDDEDDSGSPPVHNDDDDYVPPPAGGRVSKGEEAGTSGIRQIRCVSKFCFIFLRFLPWGLSSDAPEKLRTYCSNFWPF